MVIQFTPVCVFEGLLYLPELFMHGLFRLCGEQVCDACFEVVDGFLAVTLGPQVGADQMRDIIK